VAIVGWDVTERKQSEETVKESMSLLEATLESTVDGILVSDGRGRMVRFNQKFAELWRLPEKLVVSGSDDAALQFVLAQLDEPERFMQKVRELYAQPEAVSSDVLTFKDGRVFERYSQPQRIGSRIVGRVWSFRDVTERRQAEKAAQESEQRFAAMADASPALIWTSGPDKLCHYFNKTWLDFTGRSMEQEMGKGWAEGVHPEELARCLRTCVESDRAEAF
jgi:PAS domain S-box-containing protein